METILFFIAMSASVLQVSDLPRLRLTDAHIPSAGTKDTAAP